jgi:glycerate kinase
MKILIAPNAFKGSLSPLEVCKVMEKAVKKTLKAKTTLMPVSDGGDGLIEVLLYHFGGRCTNPQVKDALFNEIRSHYCILTNGSAVVEIAKACGFGVLKSAKTKPLKASSYGVGELIEDVLRKGIKKIYIGLGGSASNDGGAGMANALGVEFLDKYNKKLAVGVKELTRLNKIDPKNLHQKIKNAKIYAVSDVKNPLLGKYGSAKVYGPQKGATPAQVKTMAKALRQYAKIIKKDLNKNIGFIRGGAAAGGISAGAFAFLDAKIVEGSSFVLKLIKAERKIKNCDLVITGEGKLDRQTFYGKAPYGVSKLAKRHKKPVLFVTGTCKIKNTRFLKKHGMTKVIQMAEDEKEIKKSLKNPHKYLETATIKGLSEIKDFL